MRAEGMDIGGTRPAGAALLQGTGELAEEPHRGTDPPVRVQHGSLHAVPAQIRRRRPEPGMVEALVLDAQLAPERQRAPLTQGDVLERLPPPMPNTPARIRHMLTDPPAPTR